MKSFKSLLVLALYSIGMVAIPAYADFTTQWQLGAPLRGWPRDGGADGGGVNVDFVQEAGTNPAPGDPNSPATDQQADDDYYFAGAYPAPIGTVPADEIAMERAFAGSDNDLRIHFNLPAELSPESTARFHVEPFNLDGNGAPPRYGVEVYFNEVLIMPEVVVNDAGLNTILTSGEVSLGSVSAQFGPGGDNIIRLRGINKNAEGGGNWMGMDYHALEIDAIQGPGAIPTLSEWGLIVLSLMLLTVGVVHIRRHQPGLSLASAGGNVDSTGNSKKNLFSPDVFGKCMAATWALSVAGIGVVIFVMGTIAIRDIVGTLVCATIVAYLLHTFLPSRSDR